MLSITRMMAMGAFFLYCKEWQQQSYFFPVARSGVDNGWLQWGNARSHQATTNQIFTLHHRSGQQSWNDNIVDAMIKFLHPMLYCKKLHWQQYFFLLYRREQQPWLIAMSTYDQASNNQPFWLMWINHIDDCKRREVSAIILIAMPQQQRWQCNNHFLLSYHKEQQQ